MSVKSLVVSPPNDVVTCPQLKYVKYSLEVGCLLRSVVQFFILSYLPTEIDEALVIFEIAGRDPVKSKEVMIDTSNRRFIGSFLNTNSSLSTIYKNVYNGSLMEYHS